MAFTNNLAFAKGIHSKIHYKNISKEYFAKNNKKFLLLKELNQDGTITTQIISGSNYAEIMLDQNEDGKFDYWELTDGTSKVLASYPLNGVFQKIEVEKREKDKIIIADFYFSKNLKKYLFSSKREKPYKIMTKDDIRIVNDICDNKLVLNQLNPTYQDILSMMQKDDSNKNEQTLYEKLRKNPSRILSDNCLVDNEDNAFRKPEQREELLRSVAAVMTSESSDKPSRYLSCLKQYGLGVHAARIQAKFFGSLDTGATMDENTMFFDPLLSCKVDKNNDSAASANYNPNTRVISFVMPFDEIKNHKVNSPEFPNPQTEISDPKLRTKKNIEKSFFHEMVHSSGIESEKLVHAITDCCGNPDKNNSEACQYLNEETTLRRERTNTDLFLTQLTQTSNIKSSGTKTSSKNSADISYSRFKEEIKLKTSSSEKADLIIDSINDKFNSLYKKNLSKTQSCIEENPDGKCNCYTQFYDGLEQDLNSIMNSRCSSAAKNEKDKAYLCARFSALTETIINNLKKGKGDLQNKSQIEELEGLSPIKKESSSQKNNNNSSNFKPTPEISFNNFILNYLFLPRYANALESIIRPSSIQNAQTEICPAPPVIPDAISGNSTHSELPPLTIKSIYNPIDERSESDTSLPKLSENNSKITESNIASPKQANNTNERINNNGISQVSALGEATGRTDFVARSNRSTEIIDTFTKGLEKASDVIIPKANARENKTSYNHSNASSNSLASTNSISSSVVSISDSNVITSDISASIPKYGNESLKHNRNIEKEPNNISKNITTEQNTNTFYSNGPTISQPNLRIENSDKRPSRSPARSNDNSISYSSIISLIESSSDIKSKLSNYDFLKSLIQNKIQIIDVNKKVYGSREPKIVYEYSARLKKYIRRFKR